MRSVVAWLAKRHAPATLRELAAPLGLGRAQSVGNLTRRVDLALRKSRSLRRTIEAIEALEARISDHLSQMARDSNAARRKKKK